jgi:signal transduction histidine kinase
VLGIPTHLAPRVNAWSTVRAFHAAAIGSLAAAVVALLLVRIAVPSVHVVGAMLAVVPMLGMIGVHTQSGTRRTAIAFLLVGGVCCWWFARVVGAAVDTPWVTSYLVSLVVVPLVLVGGTGTEAKRVVLWSLLGFAVGRVATSIATVQVGGVGHPLVLAWATLAFVVGLVIASERSAVRSARIQPELLRAAREEHAAAYRAGIEAEAAAILHDTVLNHLNAIAVAPAGPMDEHLARTMDADVAMLTGRSWLVDGVGPDAPGTTGQSSAVDEATAVFGRMIDDQQALGLTVRVTGDPSSLGRLHPRAVTAVVRAVGQCLANVRKHAGTDSAEVSVFDDGVGCTVMVVDDGRGFDEESTGTDRMGLRNSVRERVGRVGGDVQIWSSPGSGTSVMMTVPYVALAGPVRSGIHDDDGTLS